MKISPALLLCAATASFGQWAGWNVVQKPLLAPKVLAGFKGQYYAAADPGVVQRSHDGKTWKASNLPSIACVNAVANSGTSLAFLGCGAVTVTQDGSNWETSQPDKAPNIVSVALSDSLVLAVSDSGVLYTSNRDLKQWSRSDSLAPVATKSLVWDGTRWVAFTDSGVVATSADAKTWRIVVSRGPTAIRNACYFKGHYFVNFGYGGVKQSEDLLYWSVLDSANTVTILGNRIVKERLNLYSSFCWSTDGASWNVGKLKASLRGNHSLMTQGDSGVVAMSDFGASVRLDSSLVQNGNGAMQTRPWNGVADCHGSTLFMGKGIYSGPFDTLTRETPDSLQVNAIACNDSVAVAAGSRQDSILVRGPGAWQYSKLPTGNSSSSPLYAAIWTGHEFVVGGSSAFISSYGNWKAGTGLQWNNEVASGISLSSVTSLRAHDSILLLGGSDGNISRAVNWKNWRQIPTIYFNSSYSSYNKPINSIVWGNGQFLAAPLDNTTFLTSPDGATWTTNTFKVASKARSVAAPVVFGAGHFFAFTSDSLVAVSKDGKTWDSLGKLPDYPTSGSGSINMLVSKGSLIVVGRNGMIATRVVDSGAVPVGAAGHIEPGFVVLRRQGGYAVSVSRDVSDAQLLTSDGQVRETIAARNGELFVPAHGRTGRFVLVWTDGPGKRTSLPLLFMGR